MCIDGSCGEGAPGTQGRGQRCDLAQASRRARFSPRKLFPRWTLLAQPGLQRGQTFCEFLVFFPCLGGHCLYRFELFAADEVHPAHRLLHAFACIFSRFAGHAGKGACGSIHELDEIGDHRVLVLHAGYLGKPAQFLNLNLDPLNRPGRVRAVEFRVKPQEFVIQGGSKAEPAEQR